MPAFVFVDADPGELVTTSITVKNQTGTDARFKVDVNDLSEGTGTSTAFEYEPPGEAPRGAGGWLEPEQRAFVLDAGRELELPITIQVPADAGAGGHFGAVGFTASAIDPGDQITADAYTPVPVFVTVSGDATRDLRVTVSPDDTLRWSGGTERWTVEIHNAGDYHETIAGRIRLDSTWSGARSRALDSGILLPGERRTQRVTFDLRSAPDAFDASVRVERDTGEAATAPADRVWVVPWWLLVVLAVAIVIVWWRVRTRRAYVRAHEEFDDGGDSFSDAG